MTNLYTRKVYLPHQPQRRSNSRASPHAQIRDHNDIPLLQVCQPYLRPSETKRQTETTVGSTENQRPHI